MQSGWVKSNLSNIPPFTHNLLKILSEIEIILEGEHKHFLLEMNAFQIKGRYPDYINELEATINKEVNEKYLQQTEIFISWLKKKLQ
ncbi:MAG: hypothetical protein HW421_1780 [Ignavibacteria bacterium]|nr:hypothetical protein [Ignavibacteria bacterium]